MKYDFTSIIDRKGKDALAVDILPNMLGPGKKVEVREGLDYIPMWVADMKSRKQRKSIKNTMGPSFPMKSGPILFYMETSIFQPSLYLKMQETERLLYTHHQRPSTLPD